jgi:hypothetical protein
VGSNSKKDVYLIYTNFKEGILEDLVVMHELIRVCRAEVYFR